MNRRQLVKLGVPEDCVNVCICIIRDGRMLGALKKKQIKKIILAILSTPSNYQDDPLWSSFAYSLLHHAKLATEDADREPVELKQWGDIEKDTVSQMQVACKLPVAVGAALMPDGHLGYGLSIGGVLATENQVVPYGVGVDISCGMKITVLDLPHKDLTKRLEKFRLALEKGTMFGVGKAWQNRKKHAVMDKDWDVTPITKSVKDVAWNQLGTSGSGNHFAEFGTLRLEEDLVGLKRDHTYVALLTHSGSRGAGSQVCKYYTKIAQDRLPKRYERFKNLAWLDLENNEGLEYWQAMSLMGQYAAANHEIIHRDVIKLLGAVPLFSISNHHNFAWKEYHHGRDMIIHRKGATPAGEGVLGVIPGSMADPGFIVKGRGNEDSFCSASHGAGRCMSRTQAKNTFDWKSWEKELKRRGVTLLSGGLDEVPGAYKSIAEVMRAQDDLVRIIAVFQPKIVKMAEDGNGRPNRKRIVPVGADRRVVGPPQAGGTS